MRLFGFRMPLIGPEKGFRANYPGPFEQMLLDPMRDSIMRNPYENQTEDMA